MFTEHLSMKITLDGDDELLFSSIYRSANSSPEDNNNLSKIIQEMCPVGYSHYITGGDFNLSEIDWEFCTTTKGPGDINFEFIECLRDLYWHQHVRKATRATGNTEPSLLGLIICNEDAWLTM